MTRVLVAYASRHGSTEQIADAIATELARHDLEVDCRVAGEVSTLDGYDAVVLGSAVYARRWQASARHFLRRHREALPDRALWVFSSGPVGEPRPEDEAKEAAWLEPPRIVSAVERLGAREHVVFGGRVPQQPHNFMERSMVRNTPPEFADRRDWEEIADWAASIARSLEAAPLAGPAQRNRT